MQFSEQQSVNNQRDKLQIAARQNISRIIEHREISPRYWRMKLQSSYVAQNARPGQFVHLLPRGESMRDPLLRRAFSVMNTEDDWFEILYRVEGKGTKNMTGFAVGDDVNVIAPLGQGFEFSDKRAILVGGGVGVPPMVMLAKSRSIQKPAPVDNNETTVIIGARNKDEVICLDDFTSLGIEPLVATDDGSLGTKGLVTALLSNQLETRSKDTIVYACGPWPMLRAVAKLCATQDVPCQVSLEENMPCGIGVCNGCVVRMKEGADEYSLYRRICVEGPVLWAHEVRWDG